MDWVRARSDQQIEQRIREIVDATARLYESNRFEEITFAMIAKEADFTRSNLYRYFETKEEIFLELLKNDLADWRKDVLETFSGGFTTLQEVSEAWVELFLKHKRLLKLFTILYTLLEQNSSLEALTAFKQKTTEEIGLVAVFLAEILPFSSVDLAMEFLYAQSALAIGMYPMLDLTPRQIGAMQAAGMDTNPAYFKDVLLHSIELLLHGLMDNGA
jgi:TetR/AcrR family transcriptional regulator